jgi:hypothetical protein
MIEIESLRQFQPRCVRGCRLSGARDDWLPEFDSNGFHRLAARAFVSPLVVVLIIGRCPEGNRLNRHEPLRPAALARHVIDDRKFNRLLHAPSNSITVADAQ